MQAQTKKTVSTLIWVDIAITAISLVSSLGMLQSMNDIFIDAGLPEWLMTFSLIYSSINVIILVIINLLLAKSSQPRKLIITLLVVSIVFGSIISLIAAIVGLKGLKNSVNLDDIESQLNELKRIYDQGLITTDEYNEKRNQIISKV